jgi:hypothetical protein
LVERSYSFLEDEAKYWHWRMNQEGVWGVDDRARYTHVKTDFIPEVTKQD